MNEKTIVRFSLLMILIGLGFLYLYADELELPALENLDSHPLQEKVRMHGTITSLQKSQKALFLQVQGERIETMDIIFFPQEEPFLKEGDKVEVVGQVEEYQGKKEIVADKVILH